MMNEKTIYVVAQILSAVMIISTLVVMIYTGYSEHLYDPENPQTLTESGIANAIFVYFILIAFATMLLAFMVGMITTWPLALVLGAMVFNTVKVYIMAAKMESYPDNLISSLYTQCALTIAVGFVLLAICRMELIKRECRGAGFDQRNLSRAHTMAFGVMRVDEKNR